MDYCSSCRRHLNGALVCPGCGAYAPDIAPPRTTAPHTGGHATTPAADDWFTAEHAAGSPGSDSDAPADVTDAPPAPQGRAARRRQLARWKKNQRRAVVATAVALVGGGITLASLDRGSGDKAQAATAPDHRSMSLTDEPSAAPSRPAPAPASPTTGHRHTAATVTAHTPGTGVTWQQSAAPAPRTVQSAGGAHTAAVAPRQAASAAPATPAVPQQRGTTTTSSSGTDTGTSTGTATGTGTSTGSSDTSTQPASGTGGGTSASSPTASSPSQTSSSGQLCLVLLCLG
ncbi:MULTISPECIES: SCO2400 family protein [unclassified Streptomyces]|uniref:SCO2400 family protein n=1 Tax=unclassified Streptomyces TaxID=2593676 RepID=UPI00404171A1